MTEIGSLIEKSYFGKSERKNLIVLFNWNGIKQWLINFEILFVFKSRFQFKIIAYNIDLKLEVEFHSIASFQWASYKRCLRYNNGFPLHTKVYNKRLTLPWLSGLYIEFKCDTNHWLYNWKTTMCSTSTSTIYKWRRIGPRTEITWVL